MSRKLNLAILISGNGSNLQSIIDAIESGQLHAVIGAVISNNPDAYGLTRARQHGIETRVLDHREFGDRAQYDKALQQLLKALDPDFIVLAGFMRILGAELVNAFANQILNIHPSLLPAYKGLNTHQRALDNNESVHGVSIHLVTAELDDGPILLQGSYAIETGDSVEDLQQKGHHLEHQMYPRILGWLSEGRLTIHDGRILNEKKPLEAPLQFSA